MARRFGRVKDYNDWLEPKLVENSIDLLKKEIPKKQKSIKSVHLCFTTDPFMYGYPEVTEMSLEIIKLLDHYGIKCTALTKGVLPPELSKFDNQHAWGISLVSFNEGFRKQYEPFSADYSTRLASIKNLHDLGCKTWVSIEPYPTPNIVEQDLRSLLSQVSFADRIIFGRLHYNKLVSAYLGFQDFYDDAITSVVTFCIRRGIDYHIKEKTTTKDSIKYIERITKPVIPILHRNDAKDFKQFQNYLKYPDLPDSYTNLLFKLKFDYSKLKQTIKKLSDSNNSINFFHELVIGYSLNEYCKKNSLELEYSPTIQGKTPDWVIHFGKQKLIIEVKTINKSEAHSDRTACLEWIYLLIERELKNNSQEIAIDYHTSRFNLPVFSDNPNKIELYNRYDAYCKEVSYRIINKLMSGYGRDGFEKDESGIEFKIGSRIETELTTRGYETQRVIDAILDKGEAYWELSRIFPLIVAVANSNWPRSKSYLPQDIARLLYDPNSVYDAMYSMIEDKKTHISKIEKRIAYLKSIEGVLFYYVDDNDFRSTRYEYYPNPHKDTEWKIPDGFKAYLEGSSNESKS